MKYKEIKFKCRCTVNKNCDSLVLQDFGYKEIMIDIWRGKKFFGVVLNKKDIKKLVKFIN